MNIDETVGTESKSAWAVTLRKNSHIKILKSHAHLYIIGNRKEVCKTKFQRNPMKDEGVEETKFLTYKAYVGMGNNSVKKVQSKIVNHMHISIS